MEKVYLLVAMVVSLNIMFSLLFILNIFGNGDDSVDFHTKKVSLKSSQCKTKSRTLLPLTE